MKNSIIFACLTLLVGCDMTTDKTLKHADIQIVGTSTYNDLSEESIALRAHGVWIEGIGKTVTHVYDEDLYYHAIYPDGTYSKNLVFEEDGGFLIFPLQDGGIEEWILQAEEDVYIDKEYVGVEVISCSEELCIVDISCTSGMSGQGVYQENQVIGLIEATDGERCLVRLFGR